LHGVAGDLLAQAAQQPAAERQPAPEVDLLLPLGDWPAPDVTAPHSWLASRPLDTPLMMPRPSVNLLSADATEPALPAAAGLSVVTAIDVDLSGHAPAPREFTRPAEFNDVDLFRNSRRSDFAALEQPIDPTPSRRLP